MFVKIIEQFMYSPILPGHLFFFRGGCAKEDGGLTEVT